MNVLSLVADKLGYFSSAQTSKLVRYIAQFSPAISRMNLAMFVKFMELITEVTSDADKEILIELALEFMAAEKNSQLPKMFEVYKGEDHCMEITIESGTDLTGYYLTARNSTDLTLLSANNIAGSAVAVQEITISDLNLTSDRIYKILYNAEHPSGSIASGNVAVVLAVGYFIIKENADAA